MEHAVRQTGKVQGVQDLVGITELGLRIEKRKINKGIWQLPTPKSIIQIT